MLNLLEAGGQPVVPTGDTSGSVATYGIGSAGGLSYEQWVEESEEEIFEIVEEFTHDALKNCRIGEFIVVGEPGYKKNQHKRLKVVTVEPIPVDLLAEMVKGSGYVDINTLRANKLVHQLYRANKPLALAGVGAALLATKLPFLSKYRGNLVRGAAAVPLEAALKFLADKKTK